MPLSAGGIGVALLRDGTVSRLKPAKETSHMPERIVREIEVLIPAILHLIRDGWTITTLSPVPHRDAELRCQDRQRVEAALREAGVDPGAITFARQGPADEGQWGSPGRRRRAPYWKALGLDR